MNGPYSSYDCSSYYSGGALALSAVTQNSSLYQMCVSSHISTIRHIDVQRTTDQIGAFLLSATIPSNGVINESVLVFTYSCIQQTNESTTDLTYGAGSNHGDGDYMSNTCKPEERLHDY
jgi:hypothetical protein